MTNTEIKEIQTLQKRGMGPQKISDITKLPLSAIKSYVSRHPMETEDVCLCCGETLKHIEHKRHKVFCSSACKNKWWYAHPHMMTRQTLKKYICPVCGTEFKDYGRRVYCSVKCYAEGRRKKNV